jgi:hypothetical protein
MSVILCTIPALLVLVFVMIATLRAVSMTPFDNLYDDERDDDDDRFDPYPAMRWGL